MQKEMHFDQAKMYFLKVSACETSAGHLFDGLRAQTPRLPALTKSPSATCDGIIVRLVSAPSCCFHITKKQQWRVSCMCVSVLAAVHRAEYVGLCGQQLYPPSIAETLAALQRGSGPQEISQAGAHTRMSLQVHSGPQELFIISFTP